VDLVSSQKKSPHLPRLFPPHTFAPLGRIKLTQDPLYFHQHHSSASRPPRTVSFGTKKKHPATIFDQRLEFTRQHRRVGSPPSLDKESTRHQESGFRGLLETRRRTLHWFTEETVNGLQKEQLSFVGNRLSRNCDANPDRMLSFQTTFHPLRISLLWTLLNTMQMV